MFDGTVNDVALAVLAGAFRDLLIAHGDRVDGVALNSLEPVSSRQRRDGHGFIRSGDAVEPAQWPLERSPQPLETSIPGAWAAGDVRAGNLERVASAAGEGAIAVPMVHGFLEARRASTR